MRPVAVFLACLVAAYTAGGHEVYLKDIKIHVTHDQHVLPSIYFDCTDDDRPPVLLYETVVETEVLYTFGDEEYAATHVDSHGCRKKCGIYDWDMFSKDDLFGREFSICEDKFEDSILRVNIPGEVDLTFRCPTCHILPPPPPPPPPPLPVAPPPRSGPFQPPPAPSTAPPTGHASDSARLSKAAIAGVVVGVLAAGITIGFVTHRVYRAWLDEEAEEARRRFHALYADPNTDIDDLASADVRRSGFALVAHKVRSWWLSHKGYRSQEDGVSMQPVGP